MLDAIVVESTEDAQAVIEFIRRQDLNRIGASAKDAAGPWEDHLHLHAEDPGASELRPHEWLYCLKKSYFIIFPLMISWQKLESFECRPFRHECSPSSVLAGPGLALSPRP